jgi:hypothetical protein
VLLIRAPGGRPGGGVDRIACYAVDTRDAWLGASGLDRIEEAVLLDPRERGSFTGRPGEPVFVVCTHGRRDPCCAERGRPLAEAAARVAPEATWESTHVGGDRFAGNLVAFPHGLYFGRVEPADAAQIVRAYREGRIGRLERYRGRSAHPFHVQAAEVALRLHLGLDRIDDAVPAASRRDGDRAEVDVVVPTGTVRVRSERSAILAMRLTCHSVREEPAGHWMVRGIDAVTG